MDAVESVARRYGFREIGTPALEATEMYVDKSGEEIVDELYSFEDKGGRQVALTPELTPTVARMAVAKQQELSKPIKVGLDPAVLALRGAPAGPLSGVLPDERRHLRLVRSGR